MAINASMSTARISDRITSSPSTRKSAAMAPALVTFVNLVDCSRAATGGRADERALLAADQRADAGARRGRSADDERRLFPGAGCGDTTLGGRRGAACAEAADPGG